MTRQLVCLGSAVVLLALACEANAVELPIRKAGLWEMKVLRAGGASAPEMTMQHCTDATTDKQMSTSFSPSKDICSKQDIQKTATGYVSDSVCGVAGVTVTSHAEITGDFNSAYTVKSTSHPSAVRQACATPHRRSRRSGWEPARRTRSPATS
jgi:hypothetical protein